MADVAAVDTAMSVGAISTSECGAAYWNRANTVPIEKLRYSKQMLSRELRNPGSSPVPLIDSNEVGPWHIHIHQYGSNLEGTPRTNNQLFKKRRSDAESDSTECTSAEAHGICLADLGIAATGDGFIQSTMEVFAKAVEMENNQM